MALEKLVQNYSEIKKVTIKAILFYIDPHNQVYYHFDRSTMTNKILNSVANTQDVQFYVYLPCAHSSFKYA